MDRSVRARARRGRKLRCDICGKHESVLNKALSVDHCHNTSFVRGILCQRCNIGLGMFDDDPRLLRAAADYLIKAVEDMTVYRENGAWPDRLRPAMELASSLKARRATDRQTLALDALEKLARELNGQKDGNAAEGPLC